jgi:hypothetical protein
MTTRRRTIAVATVAAAAALILGLPAASDAGQSKYPIKIAFGDGTVSLFTEGAPASEVLAEWSRYGKTEVIGAELVEKKLVTVTLEEVSEGEALEAILGRGFAYMAVPRRSEPGLSGFARLLVGDAAIAKEKPVDPTIPPEVRYAYIMPDKALSGEDYGKPEFVTLKELPPAPEVRFAYFPPEKAAGDYGVPVFEKMDERWRIPELRFEYYTKEFPKFEVDFASVRPPTTYPEVRFKYFCGSKASPCW